MHLVRLSANEHLLLTDMHHIISDGASMGLLINDFMKLYNHEQLPPLAYTYKDYAVWQQSQAYQQALESQKAFWLREFSEPVVPLDIPIDHLSENTSEGDFIDLAVDAAATQALKALASTHNATLSMVMLSAIKLMLGKVASQDDLTVGITAAGRHHAATENMIGMFPLVLPLRSRLTATLSYAEYLRALQATFLDTLANQSYPYEALANELHMDRTTGRNPWFDVMYLFQNFERAELSIPGLTITTYGDHQAVAYEKLNFTVNETDTGLLVRLTYSKGLFRRATIERFVGYLQHIIGQLTSNASISLGQITLTDYTGSHYHEATQITEVPINRQQDFAQLFRAQVAKTPEAIAVSHHAEQVSYQQLNDGTDLLAAHLLALGPKAPIVACLLPRGIHLVQAFVGILKAGGTYLPVDVDFPEGRIQQIIADAHAAVVLVNHQTAAQVATMQQQGLLSSTLRTLNLDALPATSLPRQWPAIPAHALAYIIYTSGTTGKPKGVMIHQLGMINHIWAMVHILGLKPTDVIAQTAAPCFDISIWQLLTGLCIGARTHVVNKEVLLQPAQLATLLQQQQVTIFQSVPSLISTYLSELDDALKAGLAALRWMIPTGEALTVALAQAWYAVFPEVPLLNAYGPAEAADDVTTYTVPPPTRDQLAMPIGKAIQNMQVMVLDAAGHVCPVGVKGEICVAGIGVGLGYLNDKEKTASAFVPNPHAQAHPDYAILYRTGDLGVYLPNGHMVCLGRRDHQVKIRGFRIETGEVESQLQAHPAISEAKVLLKKHSQQAYLVGYYVPKGTVNTDALRAWLQLRLPEYMVPTRLVSIKQMPLTVNGKVNQAALPTPDFTAQEAFVAPATPTEIKLAELWAGVLQLEASQVSATTNFFILGGHSLSAIRVMNLVSKAFGVPIALKDVFTRPTVRELAEQIDINQWLSHKEQPRQSTEKRKKMTF